jgi:RNA polymerase sigma-70 factor (ECF subfamily)
MHGGGRPLSAHALLSAALHVPCKPPRASGNGSCKDSARRRQGACRALARAIPMLGRVTTSPSTNRRRHLTDLPAAALAVRARCGDSDAIAELFRRAKERARRTAACWCDPTEVDDAVAEGFARALCRFDQLRDPEAVERWILRCVARAAIDLSRRAARQRPSGSAVDLDWRCVPAPSAADAALAAGDRLAIRRALAELPENQRRLLYLRFQQGLSVREIAEQRGTPGGTLRRQCVEASRQLEQGFLRHQLRPAAGECGPITQLLCRAVRRELSRSASRTVTAHLQYCRGCRDRRDELGELVAGLSRSRALAGSGAGAGGAGGASAPGGAPVTRG